MEVSTIYETDHSLNKLAGYMQCILFLYIIIYNLNSANLTETLIKNPISIHTKF